MVYINDEDAMADDNSVKRPVNATKNENRTVSVETSYACDNIEAEDLTQDTGQQDVIMSEENTVAGYNRQIMLLDTNVSEPKEHSVIRKAYLLTNRNNILEILSSGLIKPRSAYDKYYDDIGSLCSPAVVLLTHPPSIRLVNHLIEDSEIQFPVIVTVDIEQLNGHVQVINAFYDNVATDLPSDSDNLAIVVEGAIPLSLVKGICFRTEADNREFTLREYNNVSVDTIPLMIAPNLFDGPELDFEAFRSAFERISTEPETAPYAIWREADALAGAMTLLAFATQKHNELDIAEFANCLTALIPNNIEHGMDVSAFTLARILSDFLIRNDADQTSCLVGKVISSYPGLVEESDSDHPDQNLLERMLFFEAIGYLLTIAPYEFSSINMLDYIGDSIVRDAKRFLSDVSSELIRESHQLINEIISVIDLIIDIDQFSAKDSTVMAGVLHFIMQPEPEAILSSFLTDSDSGTHIAIAALLSGILYGRKRIPVTCYPEHGLLEYIDTAVADRINNQFGSISIGSQQAKFSVHISEDESQELLKYGDAVLMRRIIRSEATNLDLQDSFAEAENGNTNPASEISSEFILKRIRHQLSNSELADGPEYDAAVLLCTEAGWDDALTTVIPLDQRVFYMTNQTGQLQMRIKGNWLQSTKIEIRTHLLIQHLERDELEELPDNLIADVARIIRIEH